MGQEVKRVVAGLSRRAHDSDAYIKSCLFESGKSGLGSLFVYTYVLIPDDVLIGANEVALV